MAAPAPPPVPVPADAPAAAAGAPTVPAAREESRPELTLRFLLLDRARRRATV